MVMESMFQVVLNLPHVRVLEVARTKRGEWILRVESTLSATDCARCGRPIGEPRGRGERIRLRHLDVFGQPAFIELSPKRFGCLDCEGEPTTTQKLDWYDEESPNTRAFELYIMSGHVHVSVAVQDEWDTRSGLTLHAPSGVELSMCSTGVFERR